MSCSSTVYYNYVMLGMLELLHLSRRLSVRAFVIPSRRCSSAPLVFYEKHVYNTFITCRFTGKTMLLYEKTYLHMRQGNLAFAWPYTRESSCPSGLSFTTQATAG